MSAEYSYSMSGQREVGYECSCGNGWVTLTVNEDRTVRSFTTHGCQASCSTAISNGQHDELILQAIQEADALESAHDWSEEWNRRYAGGGGDAETVDRLAQARRIR